jgi:hypothetical protein
MLIYSGDDYYIYEQGNGIKDPEKNNFRKGRNNKQNPMEVLNDIIGKKIS